MLFPVSFYSFCNSVGTWLKLQSDTLVGSLQQVRDDRIWGSAGNRFHINRQYRYLWTLEFYFVCIRRRLRDGFEPGGVILKKRRQIIEMLHGDWNFSGVFLRLHQEKVFLPIKT